MSRGSRLCRRCIRDRKMAIYWAKKPPHVAESADPHAPTQPRTRFTDEGVD